jgi:hypothetical protein
MGTHVRARGGRRRRGRPEGLPTKDTRTADTSWLKVGTGLLGRVTAAFAPNVARRQTDIMEKSGAVSMSAADLRALVNDLADHLASGIERMADRISTETHDPAVRRRALAFKVDAIPAVYTAAYHVDPQVAAADTWALAFQVAEHIETGVGRDAFGPEQALARAEARDLLAVADAAAQGMVTSQKAFHAARLNVERWAAGHPIEHAFSSRSSVAPVLAEWRSENRDAFFVAGEVTDTIQNLSERLNTYAAQMPRQVRWQVELMVAELADEHDVPRLLGAAGQAVREVMAAERRAVLEDVNGQRQQTLDYLTAERLAALAALRQERIEALAAVEALEGRAVDSAVHRLRSVVDYGLLRLAVLLTVLMFSAAAFGVLVYLLTAGRLG